MDKPGLWFRIHQACCIMFFILWSLGINEYLVEYLIWKISWIMPPTGLPNSSLILLQSTSCSVSRNFLKYKSIPVTPQATTCGRADWISHTDFVWCICPLGLHSCCPFCLKHFSIPFFLANPPYALRCISGISSAREPSDFSCPSIDFPSCCLIIIILNDNYPFRYWSSYKGNSLPFEGRYYILIIFPWSLAWCLAKNGHLVESNVERKQRTRKKEERSRREMRGKGYDGVKMGWIRIEVWRRKGGEWWVI